MSYEQAMKHLSNPKKGKPQYMERTFGKYGSTKQLSPYQRVTTPRPPQQVALGEGFRAILLK